jgi:hypothetical protein
VNCEHTSSWRCRWSESSGSRMNFSPSRIESAMHGDAFSASRAMEKAARTVCSQHMETHDDRVKKGARNEVMFEGLGAAGRKAYNVQGI